MLQLNKQSTRVALWILIILVIFFAFSAAYFTVPTHDYELYLREWEAIAQGQNPWADQTNAYGPIHNVLAIPYLVHSNLPRLIFVFSWLVCSFGIAVVVHKNRSIPQALKYFLISTLLLNPLFWVFVVRYGTNDILMAFFVLASMALFMRERDVGAGMLLATAVALKFIPIIMAPFLILSKRRIRWRFAVSLFLSLVVLFGVSYLLWGSAMLHPFLMASERHSKILSIFRFLRGELSPLRLLFENPNPDGMSVYLSLLAVSAFFFVHIKYGLDSFLSSIIALGLLLLFYKVGHHQFYITFILLTVLWIGLEYERLASVDFDFVPYFVFIIWIAFVSFLYVLTDGYEGTNWREILGLPTFGLTVWMLWRFILYALR